MNKPLHQRFITLYFILLSVLISTGFTRAQKSQQKITFGSLLGELTNRESLSKLPLGEWTQHQASSYERLSVTPEDPEGWYANHDWNHFVRTEINSRRTEQVMLDVAGPGVITRIWNAGNPSLKAALRFYIDGDTIPAWEADHSGALLGENEAIGYPLSALSVNEEMRKSKKSSKLGHNLYAPIPFAKHIKITYEAPTERPEPAQGMFYNINYRLYHGNQALESLSKSTTSNYAKTLKNTNIQLNEYMKQAPQAVKVSGEKYTQKKSFSLQKGEAGAIDLNGEAAIRRILLSVKAGDLNQAMKDLQIQLSFDGKTTTDVPLGFFFGCGDQLVASSDWYHKVDELGNLACFWVMPFQDKATVKLVNKGSQPISIQLELASGKSAWTSQSMYFHCNYSELSGFETEAKKGKDFNYISIQSPGVYVGDVLQVTKAVGGWWGEGDEKIYIDGSKFPDHFGTGTEDYYGYAWGGQYPDTFAHPYIGQPIGEANRKDRGGRTVDLRVRGLDAIPFRNSLRFDMESWNWHGGKVDFAWACFWYGNLDAKAISKSYR